MFNLQNDLIGNYLSIFYQLNVFSEEKLILKWPKNVSMLMHEQQDILYIPDIIKEMLFYYCSTNLNLMWL